MNSTAFFRVSIAILSSVVAGGETRAKCPSRFVFETDDIPSTVHLRFCRFWRFWPERSPSIGPENR
jgi:hypothetical protein